MNGYELIQARRCSIKPLVSEKAVHINNTQLKKLCRFCYDSELVRIMEDRKTGNLFFYLSEPKIQVFLVSSNDIFSLSAGNYESLGFADDDLIYALSNGSLLLWGRDKKGFRPLKPIQYDVGIDYISMGEYYVAKTKHNGFHISMRYREMDLVVETCKELFKRDDDFEITVTSQYDADSNTTAKDKIISKIMPVIENKHTSMYMSVGLVDLRLCTGTEKYIESQSGRYAIKYQTSDSCFNLYRLHEEDADLITHNDKHSCSLRQVSFVFSTENAISLDSGGKIKLWKIQDDTISCLETVTPQKDNRFCYYEMFEFDENIDSIRFIEASRCDVYKLSLDNSLTNRKKNKHVKIKHIIYNSTEHYEKPKMVIIPKTAYPESSVSINQLDVQSSHDFNSGLENNSHEDKNQFLSDTTLKRLHEGSGIATGTKSRFSKKTTDIFVGVDFGTSRTKVSYYNEANQQYESLSFVEYKQGAGVDDVYEDWVLPSLVGLKDNKLYFAYEAISTDGIQTISNMKRQVIDGSADAVIVSACAGYLAYVFETAEIHIRRALGVDTSARFVFSVCLPVMQMNNIDSVQRFRRVLKLTESIYKTTAKSNLDEIQSVLSNQPDSVKLSFTEIIPESVAEIIDMVVRGAVDGRYALYDLGAGTTDLTFYNINRHYTPASQHIIDAHIVYRGFSDIMQGNSSTEPTSDQIKEFYKSILEEFKPIWERVREKHHGIEAKKQVFLIETLVSGGAANRKEILNVLDFLQSTSSVRVIDSPKDWDYTKPPYYRYAVSYGLTKRPEETLKNFLLPRECPDYKHEDKVRELSEEEILENNKKWT